MTRDNLTLFDRAFLGDEKRGKNEFILMGIRCCPCEIVNAPPRFDQPTRRISEPSQRRLFVVKFIIRITKAEPGGPVQENPGPISRAGTDLGKDSGHERHSADFPGDSPDLRRENSERRLRNPWPLIDSLRSTDQGERNCFKAFPLARPTAETRMTAP